jgi:hypothetical protein
MKYVRFIIILLFLSLMSHAQTTHSDDIEVSTGFSMLLYQSAFSFQDNSGVEVAARGGLRGSLDWQAGMRMGFGPALSEGFAGILAAPEFRYWRPHVGIEVGVTQRARFEEGGLLLRETRRAMEDDISAVYIAMNAAPLSFRIHDVWRLSILELQVGTHLSHPGRTLRVQMGLLQIGRAL